MVGPAPKLASSRHLGLCPIFHTDFKKNCEKRPCLTPLTRESRRSELCFVADTDNEMPVELEVTITKPTTDTKCVR